MDDNQNFSDLQDNLTMERKPERPNFLTILCILTFIGSGMNFISTLFITVFYQQFTAVMESISDTLKLPGMEMILEAKPIYFAVSALIYAGSLFGAFQMWKLKKRGFHIYAVFQILLILAPMYFLHLPIPSILDLFLSGTFVIMYSLNLKFMS